MTVGANVLVFEPEMLNVIGVGLVLPAVALAVLPGVIVNTHVPDAAIVPQLEGLIVVPLGRAGDGEYVTLVAELDPELVIVISLGVPVRAAFNDVLLTDSPSVDTLAVRVVSFDTQVTLTLVTFALPTVPKPFVTVHVCPEGWVNTVTAYGLPSAMAVANVKALSLLTVSLSVPLFCNTTLPDSPETVPPIVYSLIPTLMFKTFDGLGL